VQIALFLLFYFLSITMLALFGFHKYFLLRVYNKYKKQPLPLPPLPKEWPLVCIQLPVFNERYVIKRLLKSVTALEYPKDKLHIQVLDDSTDNTRTLISRITNLLKEQGYFIEHVRRKNRRGFKAGALAYGLERTSAEYIAIFDADFFPQPDFLHKTIPHLLQEGIGMVQARWGHANRNYSLLTRIQATLLDAHFEIEHLARNRSGRFFNFNGTAGVWRKKAIQEAGGWQHDTLTEDLDLSYRAQLAGWKFLYLPQVVAPAELPVEINAYKNQQHRWAKGSVQTALKLFRHIIHSNLPFYIRLEALIHLSSNIAYLMMIIPALLLIPLLKFQLSLNWDWLVFGYFLTFLISTLLAMIYYATAIRDTNGKLWPDLMFLPLLVGVGIGLSLNNSRAALEAIVGLKSDFKRTPKYRLEGHRGSWRKKLYKADRDFQHIFELLAAGYFLYGFVYYFKQGFYLYLPFFLLFQFGFLYLAYSSIKSQRT
jgi:cellulose synthase/poly-beta-1,6-N-acetylglucosamine synthase-like glycosyltransferase